MIMLNARFKVYLSLEAIDMRKSINGLSIAVIEDLSCNP